MNLMVLFLSIVAHLHVMSLDTQTTPSAAAAVSIYTSQFLRTWAEAMRKEDSFSFSRSRALISHGRELVNGVDLYSAELNAESKARLIKAGAASLRAARLSDSDKEPASFGLGEDLHFIWEDLAILQE